MLQAGCSALPLGLHGTHVVQTMSRLVERMFFYCRAPGVETRWHRPNKRSDPAEGGEEEPEGTRHATTLRPFCDSLSLERAPTKSGPTQSVTDARLTQPPYTYRNLTASLQLSCTSLLAHANRKRSARHSSTATRVSAPWPHAHEHRSHPNSITGRLAQPQQPESTTRSTCTAAPAFQPNEVKNDQPLVPGAPNRLQAGQHPRDRRTSDTTHVKTQIHFTRNSESEGE